MEGTLYQLIDEEDENVGLIHDPLNIIAISAFELEWENFQDDDEDPEGAGEDQPIDRFINMLNNKYTPSNFERVFVEEIKC